MNAAFPGRLTMSDTPTEFEAEVGRAWSQTCWVPAGGYVQLSNAQEVAQALAIIRETGCKFAIRTSGRNPNVGFSSVDQTGIVLDLRRLNSMTLSDTVGQAGAGSNWGEVYKYLEENRLSATGGREQSVGLAGFLLGGKPHHLSLLKQILKELRWHTACQLFPTCTEPGPMASRTWKCVFNHVWPSSFNAYHLLDCPRGLHHHQRQCRFSPRSLLCSQGRWFKLWHRDSI